MDDAFHHWCTHLAFFDPDRSIIDHSWASRSIPPRAWSALGKTNPRARNNSAIQRSVERSWHAHEIWEHFEGFANGLRDLCRWTCPANNSSIILYNLNEKHLRIKWARTSSSDFLSYSDGTWKKGDVLWTRKSPEVFGIGRVLFTIRLKGLRRLRDLDGQRLPIRRRFPNAVTLIITNTWRDPDNHHRLQGDLRRYWHVLPVFQEFYRKIVIWRESEIIGKLAYRHRHVRLPDEIWNVIWRNGSKDMRIRSGNEFKKWCKENKHFYMWAWKLSRIPETFHILNRWCGVRTVCKVHENLDCEQCHRDGKEMVSKPVCVRDGRWVVLGMPQGFNATFAENRPRS